MKPPVATDRSEWDDVLDHLLPEDWRETDEEVQPPSGAVPVVVPGSPSPTPAPEGGRRA